MRGGLFGPTAPLCKPVPKNAQLAAQPDRSPIGAAPHAQAGRHQAKPRTTSPERIDGCFGTASQRRLHRPDSVEAQRPSPRTAPPHTCACSSRPCLARGRPVRTGRISARRQCASWASPQEIARKQAQMKMQRAICDHKFACRGDQCHWRNGLGRRDTRIAVLGQVRNCEVFAGRYARTSFPSFLPTVGILELQGEGRCCRRTRPWSAFNWSTCSRMR